MGLRILELPPERDLITVAELGPLGVGILETDEQGDSLTYQGELVQLGSCRDRLHMVASADYWDSPRSFMNWKVRRLARGERITLEVT